MPTAQEIQLAIEELLNRQQISQLFQQGAAVSAGESPISLIDIAGQARARSASPSISPPESAAIGVDDILRDARSSPSTSAGAAVPSGPTALDDPSATGIDGGFNTPLALSGAALAAAAALAGSRMGNVRARTPGGVDEIDAAFVERSQGGPIARREFPAIGNDIEQILEGEVLRRGSSEQIGDPTRAGVTVEGSVDQPGLQEGQRALSGQRILPPPGQEALPFTDSNLFGDVEGAVARGLQEREEPTLRGGERITENTRASFDTRPPQDQQRAVANLVRKHGIPTAWIPESPQRLPEVRNALQRFIQREVNGQFLVDITPEGNIQIGGENGRITYSNRQKFQEALRSGEIAQLGSIGDRGIDPGDFIQDFEAKFPGAPESTKEAKRTFTNIGGELVKGEQAEAILEGRVAEPEKKARTRLIDEAGREVPNTPENARKIKAREAELKKGADRELFDQFQKLSDMQSRGASDSEMFATKLRIRKMLEARGREVPEELKGFGEAADTKARAERAFLRDADRGFELIEDAAGDQIAGKPDPLTERVGDLREKLGQPRETVREMRARLREVRRASGETGGNINKMKAAELRAALEDSPISAEDVIPATKGKRRRASAAKKSGAAIDLIGNETTKNTAKSIQEGEFGNEIRVVVDEAKDRITITDRSSGADIFTLKTPEDLGRMNDEMFKYFVEKGKRSGKSNFRLQVEEPLMRKILDAVRKAL